jgi:cell division transport system permease protein
MTRLRYLLREAVDNIRSNRTTTFVALATTTFTMLAMGVFLLLYLNVQEALGSLREEIKVIVYLRDAVSSQALSRLRAEIGQDPAVAGIEYVSREQALATFRAQFPSEERLLSGLGDNPFPVSRHQGQSCRSFVGAGPRVGPETERVVWDRRGAL